MVSFNLNFSISKHALSGELKTLHVALVFSLILGMWCFDSGDIYIFKYIQLV